MAKKRHTGPSLNEKIKIGVLVDLSPVAKMRFLEACQVHGGQTDFVQKAIEFYVANAEDGHISKNDVISRLDSIEKHLIELKSKAIETVPAVIAGASQYPVITPARDAVTKESPEQRVNNEEPLKESLEQESAPKIDSVQLDSAFATLSNFMGD